ncbi:hypothetical protein B7486_07670 [cyanobacterium TDX16]|nr:hypothetical protein B7486_07670 [cyanobacterium TDX16]
MTWHIVVQVGTADNFMPPLDAATPRLVASFENPTHSAHVHNDVLRRVQETTGVLPQHDVIDVLHFAMAVYSADLRVNRNHATDSWGRDFVLHLPVASPARWMAGLPVLIRMLQFLTGDKWSIELRSRQAAPQPALTRILDDVQAIVLFSGGLDSLVGGIDALADGQKAALVGHHGAGVTNSVQTDLLATLQQTYGDNVVPLMFYVQPPASGAADGEKSMRSRSILFLALGIAVCETLGPDKTLVVAENGLISLNVPLVPTRSGSSSTRTTHPHFILLCREWIGSMGLTTSIDLPYRFKTKGEMLANCESPAVLRSTAANTMSCSHPESGRFQRHSPGNHCGYCVPCIIRRASLHAAGLPQTPYNVDIVRTPPPFATDTGRDLRAFQIALERLRNVRPSKYLFDVMGTGPIPPAEARKYADVYRRGMEEVRALIG